jgi:hypothetical protein
MTVILICAHCKEPMRDVKRKSWTRNVQTRARAIRCVRARLHAVSISICTGSQSVSLDINGAESRSAVPQKRIQKMEEQLNQDKERVRTFWPFQVVLFLSPVLLPFPPSLASLFPSTSKTRCLDIQETERHSQTDIPLYGW